ncbi:MAG: TetR family transcriptional regulator [Candidatus Marinimicrobia bacterium]|nr:TetR family transcriptional regulator [Candidatus Neomarinimicrobiota bacterium]
MAPKHVDKQARRIQIYEAAINLFAKQGVSSTTIQDIADQAGIGKGTIYEYFASKDELLTDIFTFILDDAQTAVEKEWKKQDNALDRLVTFFDALLAYFENIPENFTQILLLFWAEGVIQKPGTSKESYLEGFDFKNIYLEYLDFLIETITEAQEEGIFRKDFDAEKLASSLIGAVDGVMFQWFIVGKKINMRGNFMELLRIVISDITIDKNSI